MNRKREKNAYSQTSRLETPEELQLHHNHEKNPVLDLALMKLSIQRAFRTISETI
jgi:hypothetical protein